MKKLLATVLLLFVFFAAAAGSAEEISALTYAVYPHLPDAGYYQEIIEQRWAELEPGIQLIRAEWDCYSDEAPEGIDVIMYDAVTQDSLVSAGWIRADRAE